MRKIAGVMEIPLPILYSFRRCPYAMRARMAIYVSGQAVRLREVVLRNKPDAMLEVSPKATVPVLVLDDGTVIDESLAIMRWALAASDPLGWLGEASILGAMTGLIDQTQTRFKDHLDRYKYPGRYEDIDPLVHRSAATEFIATLINQLGGKSFLYAERPMLADIAIFPFIRQFANTDRNWFDGCNDLTAARDWLTRCLDLPYFGAVMEKYPQWHEGDDEPILGQSG